MIDAAYLILITALLTDSWLNNIGSLFSTDQNATNISLINTWKQTGHSEHIWHPSVSLIRADEWPIRICLVTQFNPWSTDTLTCCQLWFHDVAVTFRQVKVHVCQRYRVVLYLFFTDATVERRSYHVVDCIPREMAWRNGKPNLQLCQQPRQQCTLLHR